MRVKSGLFLLFFALTANVFAQSVLEIIVEENSSGLSIVKSNGTAKTLEIPETISGKPVTAIGDRAFSSKGLTGAIIIPDSVTLIGDGAFANNSLTEITFGNKLTKIGMGAFAENKLTRVAVGSNVENIGKGAFAYNMITEITLPDTVKIIDDYAFLDNRIREVAFPSGLTEIGEGAFSGNRLTGIEVGGNVSRIGNGAFYNNRINSVTMPGGLDKLGKRVFDMRSSDGRIPGNVVYTDTSGNVLFTPSVNLDTLYVNNGKKQGKYLFTEGSWRME